ncbi:hypothetical protein GCM10027450_00420 [Pseudidiomarina andamanensis]
MRNPTIEININYKANKPRAQIGEANTWHAENGEGYRNNHGSQYNVE